VSAAPLLLAPSGDTTGDGDSAALESALAAAQEVTLAAGTWYLAAPLAPRPGQTVAGAGACSPLPYSLPGGAVLAPGTAFAGPALADLSGCSDAALRDLALTGTGAPAGTAGILVSGTTFSIRLEDLLVRNVPGIGVASSASGGNTVRARNVTVQGAGGSGFNCQVTDSTWTDCEAHGCGAQGFYVTGGSENSKWAGCRAEWCAYNGMYVTGAWNTGQGSGGIGVSGFSTDRNGQNGVSVNASGNGPLLLSGLMLRRDGSSGTGYAGLLASGAGMPVAAAGLSVFPGVNDDGSGTDSPSYGVSVLGTCEMVSVSGAYLHAAAAGAQGLGAGCSWRNVAVRAGGTSSPGPVSVLADSA
jgi:Right handed beta helix region